LIAQAGNEGSGGGDEYTLDFIKIAVNEIYPWLKENGDKLNPQVDADSFLKAIEPKNIESLPRVFESCDGSGQGREVEACYNGLTKRISISRALYPLELSNYAPKRGLIAHEIFRKMRIEGDSYEVTRQIPILASPGATLNYRECEMARKTMSSLIDSYIESFKLCYRIEQAGKTDGDLYKAQIATVRLLKSRFAAARMRCNNSCAEAASCNLTDLSDGCEYGKYPHRID
jgi:hypothetical protein